MSRLSGADSGTRIAYEVALEVLSKRAALDGPQVTAEKLADLADLDYDAVINLHE